MTAPSDARSAWAKWGPLVGFAAIVVGFVVHATHFDFINDDAFISFRYAKNLAEHGELTFNLGERVEGYTNFLWTLMMSGVIAAGLDPVIWSKLLGVAFGVGTLTTLFIGNKDSGPWRLIAPGLLAGTSAFACWSEGGLETSLFAFCLTLSLVLYRREVEHNTRIPWSGFVMGFAAMTRPEGLLLIALLCVHRQLLAWFEKRWFAWRPVATLGMFAVPYLPYWLWRLSYYGYPFPNTYYAKSAGANWGHGLPYVINGLEDTWLFLVPVVSALALLTSDRSFRRLAGLVGIVLIPFLLYIARVGGDFMAQYRFIMPLLPLAFWGLQEAVRAITTHTIAVAQTPRLRYLLPALLLSGATWLCHQVYLTEASLKVGSENGVDSIGWLKQFVEQTTAIGKHIKNNAPEGTSIATTAAGVIPYYAECKTLDLLALNDVYVAHNVPARSGGRPGHAKSAPEKYVLEWKPSVLIWHPRMHPNQPRPRGGEQRYWGTRGYRFEASRVDGLEPPFWSYYVRKEHAGLKPK